MHTSIRSDRVVVCSVGVLMAIAGSAWAQYGAGGSGGAATESRPALAEAAAAAEMHVFTLANPFFEGRAPGTRGGQLTEDYLEFEFRRLGLEPAFKAEGGAPSFRQPFPFGTSIEVSRQELSLAGDEPVAGVPGDQVRALGMSGSGQASGPLVFVGYGIENGPDGYSSYAQDTDLAGKIALVLRFEPMDEQGKSRWAPGGGWTARAALDAKIAGAVRRGAAGVILVNAPGADDPRTNRLEDAQGTSSPRAQQVPVVQASIELADRLVRAADADGRSLMDLRRWADENGGVVDLPRGEATLAVDIARTPTVCDNVGAVLPGRGELASQYIVIGAHFDHLGMGNFGSRDRNARGNLHPGADDNASGTAGMLILADRFREAYASAQGDARSILFIGFDAEESGLNGSRFYVRNPIVPAEQHYLMINLDMIGRLREGKLEVHGVGTAEGLLDLCRPHFAASGLTIAEKPGGLGPSDHASFARGNIPVLFFFTGLHSEYHTARDTFDLINTEGIAQVTDLVFNIVMDAATRPGPLPFAGAGRMERPGNPDTSSPAAPGAPAAAAQPGQDDQPVGPTRVRVRFGIAPGDYSGSEPGVVVGEVYEGTSAALAGLKTGDRMIKWNGTTIDTVEAWMPLLSAHNPGDKVTITIIRDGKEMNVECTLQARPQGGQ